jgi:isocitrate dehydrogenase (NAD+)
MLTHRVTLIPGDGIGPEVTSAARRAIEAAGAHIEWTIVEAGEAVIAKHGTPIPEHVLEAVRKTGCALKGPVGTPIGKGFKSVNVTMRQKLDTYACLRRTKSVPGVETPFKNVDLIVVRENTEGIYSGIEHEVVPGVVETLRVITERASLRIAEFAFALAAKEGRKKVTAVHKANIMKLGDGLFLRCCEAIARKYPQIKYDEIIIDNCCMQLVMKPQQFDVLVMENFHGDILSDLCAGLVGGLGVCGGSNLGEGVAVFEAVHGTAPDLAGRNLANPTAVMLSGVEMLHYLGERSAASRLEKAIFEVLGSGDKTRLTKDLGGTAGTKEYTDAVVAAIAPAAVGA